MGSWITPISSGEPRIERCNLAPKWWFGLFEGLNRCSCTGQMGNHFLASRRQAKPPIARRKGNESTQNSVKNQRGFFLHPSQPGLSTNDHPHSRCKNWNCAPRTTPAHRIPACSQTFSGTVWDAEGGRVSSLESGRGRSPSCGKAGSVLQVPKVSLPSWRFGFRWFGDPLILLKPEGKAPLSCPATNPTHQLGTMPKNVVWRFLK